MIAAQNAPENNCNLMAVSGLNWYKHPFLDKIPYIQPSENSVVNKLKSLQWTDEIFWEQV